MLNVQMLQQKKNIAHVNKNGLCLSQQLYKDQALIQWLTCLNYGMWFKIMQIIQSRSFSLTIFRLAKS